MNSFFRIISTTILSLSALATIKADIIGEWTLHLSYSNITEVCPQGQDSLYWVLASNHLYQYNAKTNEAEYYSTQTGLSDNSIAHIAWSEKAQCLLIAYANLNIDMLYIDGSKVNILDYKNRPTTGVKDITGALADGEYFYIKTSEQGIIKLNPKEMYIEDILVAGSAEYNRINSKPAQPLVVPDKLKEFTPVGPKFDDIYNSTIAGNRLLTVRGGYDCSHFLGKNMFYLKNSQGLLMTYDIDNDQWNELPRTINGLENIFRDYNIIAVDPVDDSHLAIGGRDGILIYRSDTLSEVFDCSNSPLVLQQDLRGTLITGLAFDHKGRLWVANSLVSGNQLYCLNPDGNWTTPFDIKRYMPSSYKELYRGLKSLTIDKHGYLWLLDDDFPYDASQPRGIVLCCDPSTGKVIYHNSSPLNQNGTSISADFITRCLLLSQDGNIWVGTSGGPVYATYRDEVFHQHIVPRNDGTGLGDYLLAGVDVYCMAEDKKGRLWVGTKDNGVYLISRDRNTEIEHFTTDNSPLPDNCINSISIDQTSGKVFFCTENGIASWQSDATEGADDVESMYCYPNPVRPEYSGDLTITGLVDGAEVIITDAMNQPVFHDTAIGGTMTWNMRVAGGDRLAPGIYFVHQINNGSDGSVFKILVL